MRQLIAFHITNHQKLDRGRSLSRKQMAAAMWCRSDLRIFVSSHRANVLIQLPHAAALRIYLSLALSTSLQQMWDVMRFVLQLSTEREKPEEWPGYVRLPAERRKLSNA